MATSGITNWPLTAGEIVQQAMVELGVLNSGDSPDDQEMHDGIVRLNGMLKNWSRKVNLWRDGTGTLLILANTGAAKLEQDVRDINSVRQVMSMTNQRLLSPWNRDQFMSLPNRVAQGNPTIYYVKRDLDSVEIRIWPVPIYDITLNVDYSKTAETITEPGQTLDISQEWGEALILNCAARLATMLGAARLDQATVASVTERAAMMEQELFDSDRPDTIEFQSWTETAAVPDILYGKGAFRRDNGAFPELKLVNMFPEAAPTVEQGVAILSRPGLRISAMRGLGPIREVYQKPGLFNGDIFTLSGNQLFRNNTPLLPLINGDGIPRFANSDRELVLTCGQNAYSYRDDGLVVIGTPDNFPVLSVAFINNLFVFVKKDSHQFYWSEVNNARSILGLSFASAQMAADDLRDCMVAGDNLFLLGQETIEVYYFSPNDQYLPFVRINQRTSPKGVIATGATVLFDNAMHFVGNDYVVYRMAEVPMRISNHGLEERTSESAHFRLFTFFHQGHAFLCLRVDGGTWVFDPAGGKEWPQFDTFELGNFIGQCATTPETGVMFGSAYGPYIYEFSDDWKDDGRMLERRFTGYMPIGGGTAPVDAIEVECNAGSIDQFDWPAVDPQLEVRSSRDGGRIFTMWRTSSLGRQGEYRWRPRYRRFGYFDAPGGLFDFRLMDPTPLRVSAIRVNEPAAGRQR